MFVVIVVPLFVFFVFYRCFVALFLTATWKLRKKWFFFFCINVRDNDDDTCVTQQRQQTYFPNSITGQSGAQTRVTVPLLATLPQLIDTCLAHWIRHLTTDQKVLGWTPGWLALHYFVSQSLHSGSQARWRSSLCLCLLLFLVCFFFFLQIFCSLIPNCHVSTEKKVVN